MNWQYLTTEEQLASIIEKSNERPQVIFKHSSRCSISDVARGRLERKSVNSIDFHFLDLITYRSLSDEVARRFDVTHASPQVLLINQGKCSYNESHMGIRMDEIIAQSMEV